MLYVLPAAQWEAIFGTPEKQIPNDNIVLIGQATDCSAWIVLSGTFYGGLQPFVTYEGFDFIYRQEWGLTITNTIVNQSVDELRIKNYPSIDHPDYQSLCEAIDLKYPLVGA
jgi:hypothetical protein